jgi:uncharacterized membrane protein
LLFASCVVLDNPLPFCVFQYVIYAVSRPHFSEQKATLMKEKLMTQWIIWILKYSISLLCTLYITVIYSLLQYLRITRFNIRLFVYFNAILICFVSVGFVSYWFRFSFRSVPFRFGFVSHFIGTLLRMVQVR